LFNPQKKLVQTEKKLKKKSLCSMNALIIGGVYAQVIYQTHKQKPSNLSRGLTNKKHAEKSKIGKID
jgi:hypothetical protein